MRHQFISEEQFKVIESRVRSGVVGRPNGRKLQRATDPAHSRPRNGEATRSASSPYKSKLEAAYASQLDLEQKAGLIKSWRYEPMSLTLAKGKRYRPDFMVDRGTPKYAEPVTTLVERLELIEVKGRTGKNRRDGMTHLRWAAQLYPMFTWRLMQWNGSGFIGEYIT